MMRLLPSFRRTSRQANARGRRSMAQCRTCESRRREKWRTRRTRSPIVATSTPDEDLCRLWSRVMCCCDRQVENRAQDVGDGQRAVGPGQDQPWANGRDCGSAGQPLNMADPLDTDDSAAPPARVARESRDGPGQLSWRFPALPGASRSSQAGLARP